MAGSTPLVVGDRACLQARLPRVLDNRTSGEDGTSGTLRQPNGGNVSNPTSPDSSGGAMSPNVTTSIPWSLYTVSPHPPSGPTVEPQRSGWLPGYGTTVPRVAVCGESRCRNVSDPAPHARVSSYQPLGCRASGQEVFVLKRPSLRVCSATSHTRGCTWSWPSTSLRIRR